jgi:Tn3 transposase DDE domain
MLVFQLRIKIQNGSLKNFVILELKNDISLLTSKVERILTDRSIIQRGAMNALARAIFFGKHGEFRERALQDQLQCASALNILINAFSVWNTVYLGKATELLRNKGALREDLLKHISPLGWEHINLLGEYRFDQKGITTLESLRPLNHQ